MQIIHPELKYYGLLRKLLTVRYLERNSIPKELAPKEKKEIYNIITEELYSLDPKDTLMVERCHKAIGIAQLDDNHIREFYVKAIRTPYAVNMDLLRATENLIRDRGFDTITANDHVFIRMHYKERNGILTKELSDVVDVL